METHIRIDEKPDLENPVLIEGLPGIGNVGRIAAEYMIEQLNAKKFAELYSPHFMPIVLIHDDEINLLKCEFYYWKNEDGNDLIFLKGDTQAGENGSDGHFEIAEEIINLVEELGVDRVFTLGGYGTGEVEEEIEGKPEVLGAVTDRKLIDEFSGNGINFEDTDSKIGMIVGGTGLLLGMAKKKGMEGVGLMGETAGFPILTDPKSAEEIAKVLIDILDLPITLEEMDKKVDEMEEFLQKLEKIQKKAMKEMKGGEEDSKEEKLRYIG